MWNAVTQAVKIILAPSSDTFVTKYIKYLDESKFCVLYWEKNACLREELFMSSPLRNDVNFGLMFDSCFIFSGVTSFLTF